MHASPTPPSEPSVARPRLLYVVALAGLVADQVSKAWAFAPGRGPDGLAEVLPGLVVGAPARNYGAWNNLAGDSPLTATALALWGLALAALALPWALKHRRRWRRCDAVGGGLVLAGLVGNSADRLTLGYVRDFLVCRAWPGQIFNLADAFLVLGALTLVVAWAVRRGGASRPESPPVRAPRVGEAAPAPGA